MDEHPIRILVAVVAATLLSLPCGCGRETQEPEGAAVALADLVAHSQEFERRVYEVTDGVHVAVGFGIANSILIEGDRGAIVVDAMGSVEAARAVRAEFEKITRKPIEALVYTHNHADHIFGARGFVPEGEVDVYAHETTNAYINRVVSIIRPIIAVRSARMFGDLLPKSGEDALVNVGIGPFLEIGPHAGGTPSLIRPNRTFRDKLEVEIAGVRLELVHAPGETNDQIFVWLPEKKVLLPGDNVYKAFPNLYTIRGTLYRDVLEWVRSLDAMRALEPEHLVPSHTRPVSGREQIAEILTAYRDAIQYVHDQTIRGINQGFTPDELVEVVKLPPHLAGHPYLQEFYGTVEWSVRSIFTGYLGWFGGDAAALSPAGPDERAAGFAELAGGPEALLAAARRAADEERYAWTAELATQMLRLEPENEEARSLKARALRDLGQRSRSPNGRNYYLTQALELEGEVVAREGSLDESVMGLLRALPIGDILAAMPVYLDAERSADVEMTVGFRFPDADESYTIEVRRGVAEFREGLSEERDVAIQTDSDVWREITLGLRNPALAFASDEVEIEGSALDAVRFLRLFR
jgi:alkyl sulfatase BDS1-like metallo-beta-lactamase superfamily hydrolase